MNRIKPVLPSLREKKRYLAFKIYSKGKIKSFSGVSDAINASVHGFIGSLGASKAGIQIVHNKFDLGAQAGIIRVNNRFLDHLKASLTMIDRIEDQDVIFRSLGVSGMINKAEQYVKSAGKNKAGAKISAA